MELAKKVGMIAMACLLVLGAVLLAFGIMLGGSVTDVLATAAQRIGEALTAILPGLQ